MYNIFKIKRLDNKSTIKKIILILILLVTLIFIFMQKDSFFDVNSYINGSKYEKIEKNEIKKFRDNPSLIKNDFERYGANVPPNKEVSLKGGGNVAIKQSFVADDDKLTSMCAFFSNPQSYRTKGKVHVTVYDKSNKSIATTELGTDLIANRERTNFSFLVDSKEVNTNHIVDGFKKNEKIKKWVKLNKGERYTLEIKSDNIKSKAPFGVILATTKKNDKNILTIGRDGENKELKREHLFASIQYKHFTYSFFYIFILLICIGILFILLPIEALEEKLNSYRKSKGKCSLDLNRILLRIMFVLTPFYLFYILEKISGMNFVKSMELMFSFEGMLNIFILATILSIAYSITNRTKLAITITSIISFIFAMANYIMLLFRGAPLIATDIINWRTGLEVAGGYTMAYNKPSLWAITLTIIWITSAVSLRGNKGFNGKKRLIPIMISATMCGGFYYTFFGSDVIENHNIKVSSFRPKSNYYKNGYALSFVVTVNMSIVEKPDDYSVERVKSITKMYKPDKAVKVNGVSKKTPNIIGIMNESFSDLQVINKFKTNRDYMPFYNSLKKNTVKGTMHTSIFGGGTACTEFEFLTGFSMQHLPFHSVPYTNRINSKTPSLTWSLKSRGYDGNITFHPGMYQSYNRNSAYPKLGFDKYISQEKLGNPKKIREFVSDQQDYEIIEREYEKAKAKGNNNPFYMFNVTIQNHGGYLYKNGIVNAGISIDNDNLKEEEAEQYLNLMKKSDEALEKLISYYKNVSEPTVIVLFGDHQPRVGSKFYNALYGLGEKNEHEGKLEKEERKYQVPFMIWANFDIKSADNVNISANYLSSYMLKLTGGKLTGYNKYLLDLYKKMPVITDIACMDAKGNIYEPNDKTSKMYKLVKEYQNVQYNGLIDSKNMIPDFFYLSD